MTTTLRRAAVEVPIYHSVIPSYGATWRDHARPIIAKVIARVGRDDVKALRRALREAYPFGERRYWPYKVWCDEVRRQRGTFGPRNDRHTRPLPLDAGRA